MDTSNFDKLSDEKRLAVLSAGITCFGKNGYKKTAISEIAMEAGVSKAALFHYFGTKKDLYLYLYNYVADEILAGVTSGTNDLFECLSQYNQLCLQLSKKHPGMFELIQANIQKTDFEDDEIEDTVRLEQKRCERAIDVLFKNVDWNRLQDGCDRKTVLNMATWVSDGCLAGRSENMTEDDAYAELERYLMIVKKAVYKPEYL